MKSILLLAAFSAAAWAGGCPAGSDPASILSRTPWAFQITPGQVDDDYSSINTSGTFRALPGGALQIVETTVFNDQVTRAAQATGRYILYPDCSGGELLMNLSFLPVQLEFTYAQNFSRILFVSDSQLGTGNQQQLSDTGFAQRAPNGCPAGLGDPLNLLNGMRYSYRAYPARGGGSAIGTVTAAIANGGGVITGTETSFELATDAQRRVAISGRYLVNSDCSGGELLLDNRGPAGPVQLDFYFSNADFSEILFLNDSPRANGTSNVAGLGRKVTGVCPADATQVLLRTPWAFQLNAAASELTLDQALGVIRALPGGTLQLTATTAGADSYLVRDGQYSGRYIVYPDCSGGELLLMIGAQPVQVEFVYTDAFDEMYLLTDSAITIRKYETGVARRAPAACPAGLTNPLALLNSMWSFRTYQPHDLGHTPPSVGMFTPSIQNGAGVLTGVETVDDNPRGMHTRLNNISGRYQVYGDCSGGEILVMNRGADTLPMQLEFVFSSPQFDQVLFLDDSNARATLSGLAGEGFVF